VQEGFGVGTSTFVRDGNNTCFRSMILKRLKLHRSIISRSTSTNKKAIGSLTNGFLFKELLIKEKQTCKPGSVLISEVTRVEFLSFI